jgi:uncharacterized protein YdeI (YjbR/CyaY-like superfamily)
MKVNLTKLKGVNHRVDVFMRNQTKWREEYALLREIALTTGLTEDFKWMHPCYTLKDKNVFLLHSFKEYIAVFFHKGVIMKDPKNLLIQQTPNVQAGRQLRFKNLEEIIKSKKVIKAYMMEAIAAEESGAEVPMKKPTPVEIPKDIAATMKKLPGVSVAFKKLTPSAQREYMLYFDGAKKEETRISRVEKYADKILTGKRMND